MASLVSAAAKKKRIGRCRSCKGMSLTYRRPYYACSNIQCGITWQASLSFEAVILPSGVGVCHAAPS